MTELSKLSLEELLILQQRAATELETRQSVEREKAKQDILAIAAKYGLDVRFGGAAPAAKASKGKRSSVAAKYRHPQDASLTWTGRGRSPVWVAEWKSKNGSLDGITIK